MTLLSSHLGPCDMDQKLSPFVILITTSHMDELDLGIEFEEEDGLDSDGDEDDNDF